MDPLIAASVEKLLQSIATEAVKSRFKGFFKHLEPDASEKAARQAIKMFAEQFLLELHYKLDLTGSLEGYQDQLTRFVKEAGPFIADWMKSETREVDLGPIERMWIGDPLPNDFDWTLVAKNYARAIRNFVKNDPALGQALSVALQQEQADSLARLLPLDPGFELAKYRDYLQKKCAQLQLSAMHATAYDRRMTLWSVFVAQSAREAAPVRDLPRELLRRLRMEGHVTNVREDYETEELREGYQSSPVNPVLEILARNLLTVVLGDPGSGKTSLLKFLVMRWVTENSGLLPIWIDLKEYAQNRLGFLKYCESACTTFGLDARELEKRLKIGEAALYVDGLDEIFDPPTRGKVIEEITAFSARYGNAPVVVTSRILGYEPERLRNAGSDETYYVRSAAVRMIARGWKHEADALLFLQDRARSDGSEEVRIAIVRELARGWKDDAETPIWLKNRARYDEHKPVRREALEALARGWKDDPEVIAMLANQNKRII